MASCPDEPAHTRRRYAVRIADTASISCTPPVFQSLHAVFVIRVSRSPTYEVLISFATKYRQPQPCLPAFMRAVYVSVLGEEGIVESGTHDQLLAKQGVYYRLWNQLPGEDTL